MWDSVQQVVRILMQVASGYLVGQGIITEDMATTFTGAVVSLSGIAWWIFWERHRA